MKKWMVVTTVLALLSGGVGAVWWIYSSPWYSLRVIKSAVEQHDVTTFEKYVDIDGVIGRLLGELPGLLSGREELKMLGEEAAQFIQEFAKDTIVKAGRSAVETFIERGRFDEKLTEQGVLSKFLKDNRVRDIKFVSLKEVKAEGKICYVTATVHIEAYDGDADVTFMMRDKGMYWQVAEMSNASGFLTSLATLQSEYRSKDLSAATLYLLESEPSLGKNTMADAYTALAKAAVRQGENDEAERLLKAVLALCDTMTEQSWTSIRAGCIADVGGVYFQLGQKDKGRELIRSAATGWGSDAATSRFREIVVRLAEDDHMEEALAEIGAIGDRRQRVQAFVDAADALRKAGSTQRGGELLEQGAQAMRDVDDAATRARLFGEIGRAWAASGSEEQASEMFAIAEENIATVYDASSSANSWLNLSESQLVAGRKEAATAAVQKAIAGLEAFRMKDRANDAFVAYPSARAAAVLYALGQEADADALLRRLPQKEVQRFFRLQLLSYLVDANKFEEALTGAGDDEIGFVAVALTKRGHVEMALDGASRVSDMRKRRGILLVVAESALSSNRTKSRQSEIANRVMRLAQGA
jgi:tetratricopeptide (TPR) repeat protein